LSGDQVTIAFTCPRFEDEPALARRPRQGVRRPRLRAPPRGRGGRGESHHRDTTRAGAARPTPDFPPTDVAQAISRALQASPHSSWRAAAPEPNPGCALWRPAQRRSSRPRRLGALLSASGGRRRVGVGAGGGAQSAACRPSPAPFRRLTR